MHRATATGNHVSCPDCDFKKTHVDWLRNDGTIINTGDRLAKLSAEAHHDFIQNQRYQLLSVIAIGKLSPAYSKPEEWATDFFVGDFTWDDEAQWQAKAHLTWDQFDYVCQWFQEHLGFDLRSRMLDMAKGWNGGLGNAV